MALERSLRHPLPVGKILAPIKPTFTGMSPNPKGDMFTGFGTYIENRNTYRVGDGHATMTTGRDLAKGSTSYCAFDWLYERPDDLVQTGRNLIWQLQMDGSPVAAVSTQAGDWSLVTRNGGSARRDIVGPIRWGTWSYFVVGVYLADTGGWVRFWMAHGDWPDVAGKPLVERPNMATWQGRTGHHTLGQYSAHSRPGTYLGSFSRFGRAATPARAIELA